MELAQRVQLRLLPQEIPRIAGLDVHARSRPALQVGGDFYDFITDGRHFTFTVGDVSGKGMPAALLMAMTRTALRSKSRFMTKASPAAIMERANVDLYDDFTEVGMFATTFVGQYLAQERRMIYANAGHSPVMYCPAGGPVRLLEADGPALGVLPTSLCETQSLALGPGDLLIVATDGLNEANSPDGELFGYDRLLGLVEALADRPAAEIATGLYAAVEQHGSGQSPEPGATFPAAHQDDDQTLVVIKGVLL
jgi:sigma-B regulation protein RsbU (phosphoserine phosphatase)